MIEPVGDAARAAERQNEQPAPAPARWRKLIPPERWRNRITLTALGAAIVLVANGFDLVYKIAPGLAPDPGLQHSATLDVRGRELNVLYGEYRIRPGVKREIEPEPSDRTPGNVFYVQMTMSGFKGTGAKLRWYTYNVENGHRVSGRFTATGVKYEAKAPAVDVVAQEWVKPPGGVDAFRVRFMLYDNDDVLLAFADTAPIYT